MVIDTSAVIAIITGEPERERLMDAILAADRPVMSAATYVEAGVVLDRRHSPVLSRQLDQLLSRLGISLEPFTASQATIARAAYRDFGRGSGHPSQLNFGDCLSYALASERAAPLLFKGDDFTATDISAATW